MKSNDIAALHRHDLTDETWAKIEPLLPGRRGQWGGIARDNRRFVNAVLWIVRTGAPWRDLPPDYGGWSNTHRLVFRPFQPEFYTEVYLAWKNTESLSPAAAALVESLRLKSAECIGLEEAISEREEAV